MKFHTVEKRALALSLPVFRTQVAKWCKELKKLKSFDSHVNLSPVPDSFRKLLEKTLLLSYLTGLKDANELLKNDKQFADQDDYEKWDIGFDDALHLFKKRKVVNAAEYYAALKDFRDIAFTVKYIEGKNALLAVKKSMERAINSSVDFSTWKKEIPRIFESFGVTPLSPHHLETVFRTNLGSAYSLAHKEQYMKDDNTAMLRYDGVPDSRISDICRPHVGKIYKKDNPVWNSIYPLNHHRCRCGVSPVSKYKVEKLKLKESKLPSKNDLKRISGDFQKNPKTVNGMKQKTKGILKKKEQDLKKVNKQLNKKLDDIKTVEEAQQWAVKNGLANNKISYAKLRCPEAAKVINKQLKELKDEHGIVFDNVTVVKRRSKRAINTPMMFEGFYNRNGTIDKANLIINDGFFDKIKNYSFDKLTERIKASCESRHWVAESYNDIVNHEIGHLLTFFERNKYLAMDKDYYSMRLLRGVSKYGNTDIYEALAELYALYKKSGKKSLKKEWIMLFNKYGRIKI